MAEEKEKKEKGKKRLKETPPVEKETKEAQPARAKKRARLKVLYKEKILPMLMKDFLLRNPMEVPKLEKIVVNTTTKQAIENLKVLEAAADDLATITGQKAVLTKARKAISNFKLKRGTPIGAMVTLRGDRMYEFFDRLVNVAIPRVRDFKGVSEKGFDGRGNYTLGVQEQIVFPEINYDKVQRIFGMNITFVTTAKNDKQAKSLLGYLGMPFRQ